MAGMHFMICAAAAMRAPSSCACDETQPESGLDCLVFAECSRQRHAFHDLSSDHEMKFHDLISNLVMICAQTMK